MSSRQPSSSRHRGKKQQQQRVDDDDDDSDAEETCPSRSPSPSPSQGLRSSQIIHSGHFMMSSPHSEHPPKKGYDFDTVNMQTCQTYHFGKASTSHISIDASLTRLFECMTLAYSGKLVSPKWKNFRGLKLLWRDKIRLNNAIWRAWYMQYVERRQNPVCHFVTPLDGNIDLEAHRSSEMITTEGKCWKRRIEIVIREYHKWRTYFKKRLQKHKDDDLSSLLKGPKEQLALFGEVAPDMLRACFCQDEESQAPVPMELESLFDMEVLMSEVSDTLFSTLVSHQTTAWPNPKEIAHAVNADMIQPGLMQLQPNLDFSFDPLQDLFHSLRPPAFFPVSPTAPSVTPLPSSSSPSQGQLMSSMQLADSTIPPSISSGTSAAAIVENSYLPLYPGQAALGDHAPVSSRNPLVSECLPPAVAAMEPSTLEPVAALGETATISSSSAVAAGSTSTHPLPPPPRLPSLVPLVATPAPRPPPPHTFARPRHLQPANGNKKRDLKKITPASPIGPQQLFITGINPAMKTDVTSSPGVLITHCGVAGGFSVVPQTQKSPQRIVPSENHQNQEQSSSIVQGQAGSGQGSPCGLDQVPSPQSLISSSTTPQMQRRGHIAEQKRRSNINHSFKTLSSLVPTLNSQVNISIAVTMQKTVEHIEKLKQEREQMQEDIRRLQEEIANLKASINLCHDQMPATGAQVTQRRFDHMQHNFNEYVKERSRQNWKFWIFSVIIKPLFESFNKMVSTASGTELCKTTLEWLERHCSLVALRPSQIPDDGRQVPVQVVVDGADGGSDLGAAVAHRDGYPRDGLQPFPFEFRRQIPVENVLHLDDGDADCGDWLTRCE
ncbi:MLX-interacting protein isoform X3 [Syngnathoides biaculeatus]|uniref:MLX-interacting protein isoform X3 n=1 Tax=Syngnathoides biaculeatus TaxID=300417 RepID=UPI002ADD7B6A|nr:MLX-interacting protein isoform X3 [Syngnathoides biaculeatus]